MTALLPALVLLPLAATPLPALLWRESGADSTRPAFGAALAALAALVLALGLAASVLSAGPAATSGPWVPALGLALTLRADGLTALLAVAVAGGGVLAIVRAHGRRAAPRHLGGVLALVGSTLGALLADDLALLWCGLELATLSTLCLVEGDRPRPCASRPALGMLVAMEAGGLAFLAAALVIADVAGSFRLADALRSGGELRAHPLYPVLVGLVLAAAAARLAPWLRRADGRGVRAARAAGLVAAALVPLRLAPALAGTRVWLASLVAFGVAALLLAAWRLRRRGSAAPAGARAAPTPGDELFLAARLVGQPVVAPGLGLSLAGVGAGAALAITLGANGARPGAWPDAASLAWPLVAGSAWLLLAAAAVVAHACSRRVAGVLGAVAGGALVVLAAVAPTGVTLAEIAAGAPALWLLARAREAPLPSRRILAASGILVMLAAAAHGLVAAFSGAPAVGAAAAGPRAAVLLVLAPIALPIAAMLALLVAGRAAAGVRRAIAGLALLANLALAAGLLVVADRGVPVGLALGAWHAPLGIHLLLDRLACEMLLLSAVLAALEFGHELTDPGSPRGRHAAALGQLQLVGVAGCVLAADLLGLVVFLELLLFALQRRFEPAGADRRAATAHVAVVGAIGTGLMLIAVACVYAALGTTGYAELAVRAPTAATGEVPLLAIGAYLLLVTLALRAAAAPVGLWLARALEAAPVAAALGVVALTAVGVEVLLRLYVLVFPCFGAGPCGPSGLVLPLGLVTVAAGGIGALAATGLRAIAAPLLLVSVGLLLVGVGSFRVAGLAAAIYALAPAALAAAALVLAGDVDGRGQRALAVAVLCAVLGLPPFPGWIARVAILGASGPDALVVWTIVLTTALFAAVAAARVARAAGAGPAATAPAGHRRAAAAGCALALLVAYTLATAPAFELATRTARQLLDRRAYVAAVAAADPGVTGR